MKRIAVPERPGWKEEAERLGFGFHTMYGAPYWDETHAYQFTLREIEDDLETRARFAFLSARIETEGNPDE